MSLNQDFRAQAAAGQAPLADLIAAGTARSPLDSAESAYRLLVTDPDPLAINGTDLGLRRKLPVDELASVLLNRETTIELRDAAWRLLIDKARNDGPAWKIAAVGVALPGLRNIARALSNGRPQRRPRQRNPHPIPGEDHHL